MAGLMWIIFFALIALLILSLLWLVWKLRQFSQSQNQTYMDDKLMQALLNDERLAKKIKKALVKQAGGTASADEDDEDSDQQGKQTADSA
ncbi:hypothetical protein GCAAIG_11650 [Candidatus Electronema halotolerans]|jgi:hypothetical protein